MTGAPLSRVALVALCLACTHARTAADAEHEERAAQEAEGEASKSESAKKDDSKGDGEAKRDPEDGSGEATGGAEAPARDGNATGAAATGDTSESGKKSGKESDKDEKVDPEDIEVATSPQGLLEPGALDKVRDKLGVAKGESVQVALRRFQREHDLPATGMLDHETVEQLGLSPDEIFEHKAGER